ncbi:hypothetical protein K443DRAFT_682522 [Laccaria amethystina LaAM-08-1]|uniref:Unplaced genomic scaffold K443scaffold_197, whole genome shotgun sequence n=1 Tax=Laccaria amethystina LaAM-08-1 TaxID=1095629 RepID=A0A0C9WKB0_9AGAR|nr:hypothetical protein K443DRAFT_682522 [Laccaria amethystina LaAM-08-1]
MSMNCCATLRFMVSSNFFNFGTSIKPFESSEKNFHVNAARRIPVTVGVSCGDECTMRLVSEGRCLSP